jgi:hypothetical protein
MIFLCLLPALIPLFQYLKITHSTVFMSNLVEVFRFISKQTYQVASTGVTRVDISLILLNFTVTLFDRQSCQKSHLTKKVGYFLSDMEIQI